MNKNLIMGILILLFISGVAYLSKDHLIKWFNKSNSNETSVPPGGAITSVPPSGATSA